MRETETLNQETYKDSKSRISANDFICKTSFTTVFVTELSPESGKRNPIAANYGSKRDS